MEAYEQLLRAPRRSDGIRATHPQLGPTIFPAENSDTTNPAEQTWMPKLLLKQLPDGYALYSFANDTPVTGGENPPQTKKIHLLYGHPTGRAFRSPNEFRPHVEWLLSEDPNSVCRCRLCTTPTRSRQRGKKAEDSSKHYQGSGMDFSESEAESLVEPSDEGGHIEKAQSPAQDHAFGRGATWLKKHNLALTAPVYIPKAHIAVKEEDDGPEVWSESEISMEVATLIGSGPKVGHKATPNTNSPEMAGDPSIGNEIHIIDQYIQQMRQELQNMSTPTPKATPKTNSQQMAASAEAADTLQLSEGQMDRSTTPLSLKSLVASPTIPLFVSPIESHTALSPDSLPDVSAAESQQPYDTVRLPTESFHEMRCEDSHTSVAGNLPSSNFKNHLETEGERNPLPPTNIAACDDKPPLSDAPDNSFSISPTNGEMESGTSSTVKRGRGRPRKKKRRSSNYPEADGPTPLPGSGAPLSQGEVSGQRDVGDSAGSNSSAPISPDPEQSQPTHGLSERQQDNTSRQPAPPSNELSTKGEVNAPAASASSSTNTPKETEDTHSVTTVNAPAPNHSSRTAKADLEATRRSARVLHRRYIQETARLNALFAPPRQPSPPLPPGLFPKRRGRPRKCDSNGNPHNSAIPRLLPSRDSGSHGSDSGTGVPATRYMKRGSGNSQPHVHEPPTNFQWLEGFRPGDVVWAPLKFPDTPSPGEEGLWPCLVFKRWETWEGESPLEVLRRQLPESGLGDGEASRRRKAEGDGREEESIKKVDVGSTKVETEAGKEHSNDSIERSEAVVPKMEVDVPDNSSDIDVVDVDDDHASPAGDKNGQTAGAEVGHTEDGVEPAAAFSPEFWGSGSDRSDSNEDDPRDFEPDEVEPGRSESESKSPERIGDEQYLQSPSSRRPSGDLWSRLTNNTTSVEDQKSVEAPLKRKRAVMETDHSPDSGDAGPIFDDYSERNITIAAERDFDSDATETASVANSDAILDAALQHHAKRRRKTHQILMDAYVPLPDAPTRRRQHYILRALPRDPAALLPLRHPKLANASRQPEKDRFIYKDASEVIPYLMHSPEPCDDERRNRAMIQVMHLSGSWAAPDADEAREQQWIEAEGGLSAMRSVCGLDSGQSHGSIAKRDEPEQQSTVDASSSSSAPAQPTSYHGYRYTETPISKVRLGTERIQIGDLVRLVKFHKPRGRPPTLPRLAATLAEEKEFLEITQLAHVRVPGEGYQYSMPGSSIRFTGNVWIKVPGVIVVEENGGGGGAAGAVTPGASTAPTPAAGNVGLASARWVKTSEVRTVDRKDVGGRYHPNFPSLRGRMPIVEEEKWEGQGKPVKLMHRTVVAVRRQ
ncbi:hypothetical protein HK104_008991 [Borealophlyctis nickersoniae]|nr:hypothetical protein HK104_008991 [Borealophlyctis nickersoniae]